MPNNLEAIRQVQKIFDSQPLENFYSLPSQCKSGFCNFVQLKLITDGSSGGRATEDNVIFSDPAINDNSDTCSLCGRHRDGEINQNYLHLLQVNARQEKFWKEIGKIGA